MEQKNKYIRSLLLSMFGILAGLFITTPLSAQDITIKASINQSFLVVNQMAEIVVEISGPAAQQASMPDLPDFGDWFRFSGSHSTSSSFSMINMQQISYSISHAYGIIPLKTGKAIIPPFKVKAGDKIFSSQPITIEIKDAGAVPQPQVRQQTPQTGKGGDEPVDIFLMAIPDKDTMYQNEGVTVEYKVYIGTGVDITEYSLLNMPNTAGFWSEDYPMAQQPRLRPEEYDNRTYNTAILKRVELFPTNTGELELDPMQIRFQVRISQTRTRDDIFDRFFNDPFFAPAKDVTINSKNLKINVKPLPAEGRPASFHGAVGNFTINADVDDNRVKAHEPVNLKITISGTGNIKLIDEPKISIPEIFEKYDPKVEEKINRSGSEITGEKIIEYVLIPRKEGSYTIDPISFAYFDPDVESYKIEKSAPIRIVVEPGDDIFAVPPRNLTRDEIKLVGRDIRFIKESVVKWKKIGRGEFSSWSFILLLLMPVLTVGVAFVYSRHLRRLNADIGYKRSLRANAVATKRLKKAKSYLEKNVPESFYPEIARALQEYIADKLNIAAAGIVTGELEKMLKQKRVDEDLLHSYIACLRICDYHRFSSVKSPPVEMRRLYEDSRKAIYAMEQRLKKGCMKKIIK